MVDKKTVEHVAQLARIDISQNEKEYFGSQLSKILDFIDKLKDLNVDGVEPLRNLYSDRNIFRLDEPEISPSREDILKNSPQLQDGCFKVPPVIE